MRDRFSILAFLSQLARWLMRGWQKQSSPRRVGLICLALALTLVLTIPLARLMLDINPYHAAAEQVLALLATQPDFEAQLRELSSDRASLLEKMQPTVALEYIHWYDAYAARADSQAPSVTARLAQHLDQIAYAVLRYQRALGGLTGATAVAYSIGEVRSEDVNRQMTALQHIHAASPLLLAEIHEIRRANQLLAAQLSVLEQDASLQDMLAGLQSNPTDADEQTLLQTAGQWQQIERLCQSTEIQLANTVSILNQAMQIIQPVYRQDQIWGFSSWMRIAAWLDRRVLVLISLAAMLGLSGALLIFWRPALPHFDRSAFSARRDSFHTLPTESASPSDTNAPVIFAQQSGWLVKGLTRRMPVARLNLSRRGVILYPRLLVPVTDGKPVEKPLPSEGILRIGNDPAFSVKIPFSGSEYIEFWIQKARRGYFIEVMFSDVPVLHNHRPLTCTRALNHGDQIQIQDTTLVFLEH